MLRYIDITNIGPLLQSLIKAVYEREKMKGEKGECE